MLWISTAHGVFDMSQLLRLIGAFPLLTSICPYKPITNYIVNLLYCPNCSASRFNTRILGFQNRCFSNAVQLKDRNLRYEKDIRKELVQVLCAWHARRLNAATKLDRSKIKEKSKKETKKKVNKFKQVSKNDLAKISKFSDKVKRLVSRSSAENQDLLSFVEACVHSNMVPLAHITVLHYHFLNRNANRRYCYINDSAIFTTLLHAWAKKGNFKAIQDLFNVMRKEGLTPDMQAFAASLECLGRQKKPDISLVKKIINQMEKNNFKLQDILKLCTFKDDEKERILEVIRKIKPHFIPQSREVKDTYDCKLLKELNKKSESTVAETAFSGLLNKEKLLLSMHEQLQREQLGTITVQSIFKRPPLTPEMKKKFKELKDEWRKMLLNAFMIKLNAHEESVKKKKKMTLCPYLKLLPPADYVNLMLQEILYVAQASEMYSPTVHILYYNLGTKVMNYYLIQQKIKHKLIDKLMVLYEKYLTYYLNREKSLRSFCVCWQSLWSSDQQGPDLEIDYVLWPYHVTVGVGKFLYDLLLNDVKFDVNILKEPKNSEKKLVPTLFSIYRYHGSQTKEEIKPHPVLVKFLEHIKGEELIFNANLMPMIVPPLPWTSVKSGGFLVSLPIFVRLPDTAMYQRLLLERMPQSELNPVFDSLNSLGSCPWIINQQVLDVLITVFNDKGNMDLDIIPPPSEWPVVPKIDLSLKKEERMILKKKRNQLKRQNQEMYSLWCSLLYMLSIANAYRHKVFWFPHNVDFRGRVYPLPPHFNHLGSDIARSILLFAEGRPLGEKGFDWLKIHLINLTGLKKRNSLAERLNFANEIMPEILDSADNPLNGNKWWMTSDEPWQTLACCMEIGKVVRLPDPTKYICHFPVHQDGSCNGLQHYAALGRDKEGAEQVNLHPSDQPQDVYTGVANLVEVERIKDEANGIKVAKDLKSFVRRKVIKQTIMTTVYGVTPYGAQLQILRQLKDISEFPQDVASSAATYLAKKTFHSLQEMFTATKQIQDWLVDCAEIISHFCGQPVEWITPLGFPIVQPYHKKRSFKKKVEESNTYLTFKSSANVFEKPNVMKQKNAFPPNYIHSLDSTHMMLTALFCQRENITFVSVHDCFWTHPSTVPIMNRICREQFVALHREPLLDDLSFYLLQKFGFKEREIKNDGSVETILKRHVNKVLTRVPPRGTFALENVLQSTYFFS